MGTMLRNVGLTDVIDIALVATLLYVLFVALKRTRTTFVIVGIASLSGLYIVALALGLRLTAYLFQILFAVILVGLIVIFHEELRVSLQRFFSWDIRLRGGRARPNQEVVPGNVQMLVTTVADLARERIGALIVIRGKDDASRFVRGGTALNGRLSEALLKSIFDTHSLGHDGAVLVEGDTVTHFACHLPLSADAKQLRHRGTRHAAALGLSSKTDSLSIVVSEERGTVSIAQDGKLRELREPSDLSRPLNEFYRQLTPASQARPLWGDMLTRHLGLKFAALGAAVLLWFLFVHESAIEYRSFTVDIDHAGVPPGLAVKEMRPSRATIIVSASRRSFYFRSPADFRAFVNLLGKQPGEYEITLTATDLTLPEGMTLVNIVPRFVHVSIGE